MPLALTLLELAPSQSPPHRLPEKGRPTSCDCGVQIISNSLSCRSGLLAKEGAFTLLSVSAVIVPSFFLETTGIKQAVATTPFDCCLFSEFRRLNHISSIPPGSLLGAYFHLSSLPSTLLCVTFSFCSLREPFFPPDTSTTRPSIEVL